MYGQAHWEQNRQGEPRGSPSSFAMWMGSEKGYSRPALGGDVRQVELRECSLQTRLGFFNVGLFVVKWRSAKDQTHLMVAQARIAPDASIQIIASGQDSTTQTEFVSALRTIVITSR